MIIFTLNILLKKFDYPPDFEKNYNQKEALENLNFGQFFKARKAG